MRLLKIPLLRTHQCGDLVQMSLKGDEAEAVKAASPEPWCPLPRGIEYLSSRRAFPSAGEAVGEPVLEADGALPRSEIALACYRKNAACYRPDKMQAVSGCRRMFQRDQKSVAIAWLALYVCLSMKQGASPKLTDLGS